MPESQSRIDSPDHRGPIVARLGGYSVIDCELCGFKHIWPQQDQGELESFYQDAYYTQVYPFSGPLSAGELEYARAIFSARLDYLESTLPARRRSLLDIGAGNCSFLHLARERGWRVLGIEPSLKGKERARLHELPFICDLFSAEKVAEAGPFDAIHLNCVLEHVPHPIRMLEDCLEVLDPGGYLYLSTPNDFNPLQKAVVADGQQAPWWIVPDQHVNYFDTKSLPRLLERVGFELRHTEVSFPIELFLLFGENYVEERELGASCYQKICQFEQRMRAAGVADLLADLYKAFEERGIGRRIDAAAQSRLGHEIRAPRDERPADEGRD